MLVINQSDWGLVQVPTSVQPIGVSVDQTLKYQLILLMVHKLKRLITMLVYCQDGKHNLELDILDFIKIF
jgi:hypothetical protein